MPTNSSRQLSLLDQASQMLAEARTLDEIKVVRDKAEAARTFAKAARLGLEMQNHAAELKLRAERRAGEYLARLKLRGGDRRSKRHDTSLKLEDLGISRDQSKRWQKEALVPETEFESYLTATQSAGREVSAAGLLRIAHRNEGSPVAPTSRQTAANGEFCRSTSEQRSTRNLEELVRELGNHRDLLAQVLRPVYERGELSLARGERKVVGHLLAELETGLKDLMQLAIQSRWDSW